MRVFKQLTLTDRIRIEKWLKDGLRVKEIADRLRVDPSTVPGTETRQLRQVGR